MRSPKSLKQQKLPKRKLLVIRRVNGRSMMPFLNPGQIVIAHGFFRSIKPGDIVIFWHDNREKIKRVKWIEKREMFLLGDNDGASTDSRHFGAVDPHHVIAKIIS